MTAAHRRTAAIERDAELNDLCIGRFGPAPKPAGPQRLTNTHDFSQASYRIGTLIELKDTILTAP